MKLSWTRQAIGDLTEAREFIAMDDPAAARRVADRLVAAADSLLRNPEVGKAGRIDGTRELVVPKTKYLVIYRVRDDKVEIIHVYHARREWPPD